MCLHSSWSNNPAICCLAKKKLTLNECHPEVGLSSCDELIADPVLRGLIWIVAATCLLFNAVVARWRMTESKVYTGCTHTKVAEFSNTETVHSTTFHYSPQVQSYLFTNLAVGDFFMGVYLTIIAAVDVHYRGDYARHDSAWKQSELCTFAGVLSTLSGELSVLTLTVITLDRFIALVFNSPLVRISTTQVKVILILLWVIAAVLCVVPLLDSTYFENFYGQSEMCLPLPIASERQRSMDFTYQQGTLKGLETKVLVISRIPKPNISGRPNGWEYSIFVFVGINGTAFLAISIMYVCMFISIKRTHAAARSSGLKKDLAVAKNMIFIVGTDALCWFPVIGLAAYCLQGNSLELRVRTKAISPTCLFSFVSYCGTAFRHCRNPNLYYLVYLHHYHSQHHRLPNIHRSHNHHSSSFITNAMITKLPWFCRPFPG